LDADPFTAFKQSGESADDEGMVQWHKFHGQKPSIEPLLEKRGLK
jgi:hypothetical protein